MEFIDYYDEEGNYLGKETRDVVHRDALWHNTVKVYKAKMAVRICGLINPNMVWIWSVFWLYGMETYPPWK